MALSLFSTQVVAFVPGTAVTVQQSTRVAAASNIVAVEVRPAPLAHAHTEQTAESRRGQDSGLPEAPSKAAIRLYSHPLPRLRRR